MGRPRKRKVSKDWHFKDKAKMIKLLCSKCNLIEVEANPDTEFVICWKCCVHMGPEMKSTQPQKKTGFPRGWKFYKEFVDKEGNVYHRGVLQPKLKGKCKPTVIEEKPKLSKHEKRKKKEEKEIKKMKRLAKQHKKKMKIKRKRL